MGARSACVPPFFLVCGRPCARRRRAAQRRRALGRRSSFGSICTQRGGGAHYSPHLPPHPPSPCRRVIMFVKIALLTATLLVAAAFIDACAPRYQAYQRFNEGKRESLVDQKKHQVHDVASACTQCVGIIANGACQSAYHSNAFTCATPGKQIRILF